MLDELYKLDSQNKEGEALDLIFETVRNLELTNFKGCNDLLASVDVSQLKVVPLLGFLSSTYIMRKVLKGRRAYADRVRAELLNRGMPASKVSDLVDRLV